MCRYTEPGAKVICSCCFLQAASNPHHHTSPQHPRCRALSGCESLMRRHVTATLNLPWLASAIEASQGLHNIGELLRKFKMQSDGDLNKACAAKAEPQLYGLLGSEWSASVMTEAKNTDTGVGRHLMGLLNAMRTIRRVTGQAIKVNDAHYDISAGIPSPNISITEIWPTDAKVACYNFMHDLIYEEELGHVEDAPKSAGFTGGKHVLRQRSSAAASFDPKNALLFDPGLPGIANSDTMMALRNEGLSSFDWYFAHTTPDDFGVPPSDRWGMFIYQIGSSPKPKALAKDIHILTSKQKGARIVVFAHWPVHIWILELFATLLGLNHKVITAGVPHAERIEAVQEFTDPDSDIQLLICSSPVVAESLSLQAQSHCMKALTGRMRCGYRARPSGGLLADFTGMRDMAL